MSDEITNKPAPTETPQVPNEVLAPESAPTQPENPIYEPNPVLVSPQEPTAGASIPTIESETVEAPSGPTETPPSPESAVPVKDDISANEPLSQPSETAQNPTEPQQTEVNPEQNPPPEIPKNPPEIKTPQPTAQMAGNEPFDKTQDKPIDLAEEIKIKQRKENLKLANETRQEKKREKIDAILDLFAKQTNLTNDEVEKLLHVSDATATRYLETLEKENKIRQVGITGRSVKYEKI